MPSSESQSNYPDPYHVAIVMDGNGRWAQRRNLPRADGHRAGVKNVKRILQAAQDLDIRILTLYAFSAENWNRPKEEVDLLMRMLKGFLEEEGRELIQREIRLLVAGDPGALPDTVRKVLEGVMDQTRHFDTYSLVLALNYGSRQETLRAVKAMIEAVQRGKLDRETLSWQDFESHLYTAGLPDPDLVIRTSGEYRLSNFLLLQSAYSEFIFSPHCWPDFDGDQLRTAVKEYKRRERRFGQTGDQVKKKPLLSSLFNQ